MEVMSTSKKYNRGCLLAFLGEGNYWIKSAAGEYKILDGDGVRVGISFSGALAFMRGCRSNAVREELQVDVNLTCKSQPQDVNIIHQSLSRTQESSSKIKPLKSISAHLIENIEIGSHTNDLKVNIDQISDCLAGAFLGEAYPKHT